MKRIIFAYSLFTFLLPVAYAQDTIQVETMPDMEYYYNSKLRNYFSNLTLPNEDIEFLYEMAIHTMDTAANSVFFDDQPNDTSSAHTWLTQYREVRYMAYDTSEIQNTFDFGMKSADTIIATQKIPIGIIHINYNQLKPDALTSLNYFEFDTINDILQDDLDRTASPYIEKSVFSTSALFYTTKGKTTFVLDKEWYLTDNVTNTYYNNPGYVLAIDFGDGNGTQVYNANERHEIEIDYATEGDKTVKIELKDIGNGSIIGSSFFRHKSAGSGIEVIIPNIKMERTGMKITRFNPCIPEENLGSSSRKIAVVVGGFDPFNTSDATDIYKTVCRNTQIEDLRRFGYEFHVVDFNNTFNPIQTNALYLNAYLDELKCELINGENDPEPMVVIGYSMGGLVARYALAHWENNPQFSNCDQASMHFTRLLLTLDSPHQGANVPLAYQHFFREVESLFNLKFLNAFTWVWDKIEGIFMLDAPSAQQMLMYHVDTRNINGSHTYSHHLNRAFFIAALNNVGNYPKHCKVVATSNGSAAGLRQKKYYNNNQRSPGDPFLDAFGITYMRFLITVWPMGWTDIKLRSANGSSEVYKANGAMLSYKFPKLFGVPISPIPRIKTVFALFQKKKAYVHSYDVEAGGLYEINWGSKTNGPFGPMWPRPFPIIHAVTYNISLGSNNWIAGAEAGFGFLGGVGGFAHVKSEGFHFNFVPLRSALDFMGDIKLNIQSPPIESYNPLFVVNNTPIDVVLGVANRYSVAAHNYNRSHLELHNPRLYEEYSHNPVFYTSCAYNSYLLNREIGDENLYLENLDSRFTAAHYEAELNIFINERNPAYKYASQTGLPTMDPAAFSKENPFLIAGGNTATFSSPNFLYNPPQSGTWNHTPSTIFICCNTPLPLRKKNLENFTTTNSSKNEIHWMGEMDEQQRFHLTTEDENSSLEFQVFSSQGKLIQEGVWVPNGSNIYTIRGLNSKGIHILKVKTGSVYSKVTFIVP